MKLTKSNVLLCLVIAMIVSCKETPKPKVNKASESTEAKESTEVESKLVDSYIISSSGIGKITSKTKKTELETLYKKSQLKEKVVNSYEGIDIMGTEITSGSQNDVFTIEWNKDLTPMVIRIENPASNWKTKDGIGIGSTIKEVQTSNKKPFTIYGYEIDSYLAGTIKDYNSGDLQWLSVQFETTKKLPGDEYVEIMGDTGISSENPILEKAGLVVSKISINFSQEKMD